VAKAPRLIAKVYSVVYFKLCAGSKFW